jgi:hypothetical protein
MTTTVWTSWDRTIRVLVGALLGALLASVGTFVVMNLADCLLLAFRPGEEQLHVLLYYGSFWVSPAVGIVGGVVGACVGYCRQQRDRGAQFPAE